MQRPLPFEAASDDDPAFLAAVLLPLIQPHQHLPVHHLGARERKRLPVQHIAIHAGLVGLRRRRPRRREVGPDGSDPDGIEAAAEPAVGMVIPETAAAAGPGSAFPRCRELEGGRSGGGRGRQEAPAPAAVLERPLVKQGPQPHG